MLRKLLVIVLFLVSNNSYALNLREDSSYLEPFLNQKWSFSSSMKSETITFSNSITTSSATNYKTLLGVGKSDNSEWKLSYDQNGYDLYYSYIDANNIGREHHFKFRYSGTTATEVTGTYYLFSFKSIFDTSKSDSVIITGKLLNSAEQSQTTQPPAGCTAFYRSSDQTVHIPCLKLEGDDNANFNVIMKLINQNPLDFRVIELK